jgi:hypothetical protein
MQLAIIAMHVTAFNKTQKVLIKATLSAFLLSSKAFCPKAQHHTFHQLLTT